MPAPNHPERHANLLRQTDRFLSQTLVERPKDLAATAPGSDHRVGPETQVRNFNALYRKLLAGERLHGLRDVSDTLDLHRRQVAALLALPGGPTRTRLNPIAAALVHATAQEMDAFAPVQPQVLVAAAPNSPAPGVHRRGQRAAEDGRTFGVSDDGHQRIATAYLSATYGPQEQFGYAAPVAGWIRPAAGDDEQSADDAERLLALTHPAEYLARLLRQVTLELDAARPGLPPLPVLAIDGRRDCPATDGLTLETRLDVLIDDPGWGRSTNMIPGERVKMIEASDSISTGGGGFNANLVYRTASATPETLRADQVRAGVEGRDAALNARLAEESDWLNSIDPDSDCDESTSVMVFKGCVIDKRTGERGRLLLFVSYTAAPDAYVVIPWTENGDPYPGLGTPGAHPLVERDIALAARLHVGPSQWTGQCRRNAHHYRDYFYVASKLCAVREMTFALGVNVRMSDTSFPGEPIP
jgi:hypothetical protein